MYVKAFKRQMWEKQSHVKQKKEIFHGNKRWSFPTLAAQDSAWQASWGADVAVSWYGGPSLRISSVNIGPPRVSKRQRDSAPKNNKSLSQQELRT